jgi:hypothetical protein
MVVGQKTDEPGVRIIQLPILQQDVATVHRENARRGREDFAGGRTVTAGEGRE